MASAKGKIKVGAFENELIKIEAVYDFAKDGGAVSVIDLMETAEAMVIHSAHVKVKTAVTSGGAATIEIGVKAGDTDAILPATLQAALTSPKNIANDAAATGLYLASGAILSMEIKVAALTAGKVTLVVFATKY